MTSCRVARGPMLSYSSTALGPANDDRIPDFGSCDEVFKLDGSVFVGLSTGALDDGSFVIAKAGAKGRNGAAVAGFPITKRCEGPEMREDHAVDTKR
jgi:hypothetical protein